MGNPDEERTTINVKSVSVSAWERAKKAAAKQDDPMGVWLSRAAHHLADMEAGPREFPPAPPPPSASGPEPAERKLSATELAALMQASAAFSAATGVKPAVRDAQRLHATLDAMVREGTGQPPRTVRPPRNAPLIGKAEGQSLLESG
jgi:hypothetical protein